MKLPNELNKWSSILSLLPTELALSLGKLIKDIEILLLQLDKHISAGAIEPEGYKGLSRHGSYQRLAISEWLLADELPLEFDRRAAMNEHLFYQLQLLEHKGQRYSIVLLDRGFLQLGAPRLVHLAIIILMQRRAQLANCQFYWGCIQQPKILTEKVSAKTLNEYIKTKKLAAASEQHLTQWQSWLQTHPYFSNKQKDIWLVTALKINNNALCNRYLCVNEMPIPGKNQLSIEVIHNQYNYTKTITLPEDEHCVRLIREPFKSTATKNSNKTKIQLNGSLFFCKNATKLLIQSEQNGYLACPIPSTVREPIGNIRQHKCQAATRLVAMQIYKRRLMSISHVGNELVFNNIPWIPAPCTLQVTNEICLKQTTAVRPFFYTLHTNDGHPWPSIFFIDDRQQLFRLYQYQSNSNLLLRKMAEQVLSVTQIGPYISYANLITTNSGNTKIRASLADYYVHTYDPKIFNIKGNFTNSCKVLIFYQKKNQKHYVAVGNNSQWIISNRTQQTSLQLSTKHKVIGLFPFIYTSDDCVLPCSDIKEVYLIYLNTETNSIYLCNSKESIRVCREDFEIQNPSYDPIHCRIAYNTQAINKTQKIIAVYSLLYKQFLLRLS